MPSTPQADHEPARPARVTACTYDPLFLAHNLPGHPENRTRLERIMAGLGDARLLDRMTLVPPRPADLRLLARVHDAAYVKELQTFAEQGGGHIDADTYVGRRSFDAARLAAGGAAELVRAVLGGRAQNGIALVRPPGHHAVRAGGMGFCLLNNVAVAAQAALDEFGAQRVLIVDWDVHHGNGTQDIFYQSPQVLCFSTHQYPYYPGSGSVGESGAGTGRGATVNVPLPAGVGADGFRRVYADILTPLAERFQPELILISAGFDAHWDDPLAGFRLSLSGFWELAQTVLALADLWCSGKVIAVLEGGYNLTVLSHAVADLCRALLGEVAPGPDPLGPSPWPERGVEDVIRAVRRVHGLEDAD
jgi:acetoin utilization deacetylase AcuC-like enzyme